MKKFIILLALALCSCDRYTDMPTDGQLKTAKTCEDSGMMPLYRTTGVGQTAVICLKKDR